MDHRIFEDDSEVRALETEVIEAGNLDGRPFVRLEATIFYPDGGGQPADHGRIGEAVVEDVQRQGDRILHLLDRPLAPGPVRIEVDWERRFDHMQQHTGQHLLTAICQDRYGRNTHAFHLGETYSSIDLDGPDIGPALALEVEDAANEVIRASRPVRILGATGDSLGSMNVRTRGLPDDLEDTVRLVEIEGVDLNTCGGTHVRSTAELQVCRLLGTEKAHEFRRLKFAFGNRAIALLRASAVREAALKKVLGAAPEAFAEVAAGRDRDRRDLARALKRTEAELAEALAAGMRKIREDPVVRHLKGRNAGFLRALSRKVLDVATDKCLVLFGDDGKAAFFLVAAGEASTHDPGEIGSRIQEALGGKGGGRGREYQGRGPDAARIPGAVEAVFHE